MHSLGPVVAVVTVFGLMGVLRWIFSTTRRERHVAQAEGSFGTLVPVAESPDEATARRTSDLLATGGVRATVALTPPSPRVQVDKDGRVLAQHRPYVVLVFSDDADVARALLRP